MALEALIIAAAILAGPIIAAIVLLEGAKRARVRERRIALFYSLLRSRRLWLSGEWIGGLNAAVVEFSDNEAVMAALKRFTDINMSSAWAANGPERQRVILDAEDASSALLMRMAEAVGAPLKISDLRARNFSPAGALSDEMQRRRMVDMAFSVLSGARALKVEIAGERTTDDAIFHMGHSPPIGAQASGGQPNADHAGQNCVNGELANGAKANGRAHGYATPWFTALDK